MSVLPRIRAGDVIERFEVETVSNERLSIPADFILTHLQFRRFAGCPVCTLHLRSFVRRHDALKARRIREVVVFHSSRGALLEHHADFPFALVADPSRQLYRKFGVDRTLGSLLNPAAWPAVIKGAVSTKTVFPERALTAFELPADFLVAPDGRVLAGKYGRHADDQWSVDELISLSNSTEASKIQQKEYSNERTH